VLGVVAMGGLNSRRFLVNETFVRLLRLTAVLLPTIEPSVALTRGGRFLLAAGPCPAKGGVRWGDLDGKSTKILMAKGRVRCWDFLGAITVGCTCGTRLMALGGGFYPR